MASSDGVAYYASPRLAGSDLVSYNIEIMRMRITITMVACVPAIATAHHSTRAFYDREVSAEIEGVVASIFWRNPHVRLTLLVENQQGQQEEWELEGGAINTLSRRGFAEESFRVGDRVRVAGAPSIRGLSALFVTNMLLPSGKEVVFTDQPQQGLKVDHLDGVSPSLVK